MKAVLIGAGKIGRGFIGQILHDAGYSLSFVDVSKQIVMQINAYGEYPVYILGADEREVIVDNIKAFLTDEPQAIQAFAEANLVTTAVGPAVLTQTAAYIAKGIRARCLRKISYPLTIIACENMENATTLLRQSVEPLLTDEEKNYCNTFVGFPDAEVSRMALPMSYQVKNPLAVKVEQYTEWIVDKNEVKDDLSHIGALVLSDNPQAFIKRKIFTLTGHAMLGFLGYQKGYEYIHEAAYDDEIFNMVYSALMECGKAWNREFDIPTEDFNRYITVMLRRFSDTRLKDPVKRVCYQPIRKLSRNERFIAPALSCCRYGIVPKSIMRGIIATIAYDSLDDEQAGQLQLYLKNEGIEGVLKTVCGLREEEQLYQSLVMQFSQGEYP